MRLVEFELVVPPLCAPCRVWINPEMVVKLVRHPQALEETLIYLTQGTEDGDAFVHVEGCPEEVIRKIKGGQA